MREFVFEDWSNLAKVDPRAFEARREVVICRYLAGSSNRQRKLGTILQREIDSRRARACDPDAAFREIALMLCEELAFFSEELNQLGCDLRSMTAH